MKLKEILEIVRSGTFVFITVDRKHKGTAEEVLHGSTGDILVDEKALEATVTSLHPDDFGQKIAGGLAIFCKE